MRIVFCRCAGAGSQPRRGCVLLTLLRGVPLLRPHSSAAAEPLRPLRHRMFDDFIALWRQELRYFRVVGGWDRGWLLSTKGGVLSTFVAGGIFFGAAGDLYEYADGAADVARDDLHKQLERLLRPTAVRKVARAASKDGVNGVVYFLIRGVPTISKDFAVSPQVDREYDAQCSARQALLRRLFSKGSTPGLCVAGLQ